MAEFFAMQIRGMAFAAGTVSLVMMLVGFHDRNHRLLFETNLSFCVSCLSWILSSYLLKSALNTCTSAVIAGACISCSVCLLEKRKEKKLKS